MRSSLPVLDSVTTLELLSTAARAFLVPSDRNRLNFSVVTGVPFRMTRKGH
jgi:hypothetical protein